jgi:cyclophilin family peptidyl-prolyl cis-trans isomerase
MKARLAALFSVCVLCLLISGCPEGGVFSSTPALRANTEDDILSEQNAPVTLRVTIVGGSAPYVVRWNVEREPIAANATIMNDVSTAQSDGTIETMTSALTEVGFYAFRVVVTDSTGRTAVEYYRVNVVEKGGNLKGFGLSIAGPGDVVDFGSTINLEAETAFAGNYRFEWSLLSGDGTLTDTDQPIAILDINGIGDIVVQLTATDTDSGDVETQTITVVGGLAIDLDVPGFMVTTEVVNVTASVTPEDDNVEFEWRIVSGDATIENENTVSPSITPNQVGQFELMVTATRPKGEGFSKDIVRSATRIVATADSLFPQLTIETDRGEIPIQLNAQASPNTVGNFLRYVDAGYYNGILFHRIIEGFVIQAGGFFRQEDGDMNIFRVPDVSILPAICPEAPNGASNLRGTLAMAMVQGVNPSATSEFFINVENNGPGSESDLDGRDPPFTVFGNVIPNGMDIVDEIAAIKTDFNEAQTVTGGVPISQYPVEDVTIIRIVGTGRPPQLVFDWLDPENPIAEFNASLPDGFTPTCDEEKKEPSDEEPPDEGPSDEERDKPRDDGEPAKSKKKESEEK